MNILDDAFNLAKRAYGAKSHAKAKEQLQEKYPAVDWSEILDAHMKACDLADSCYDFGDQCRDKKMTNEEALATMRERFPGFSDATYKSALSQGYFISR